MNINGFEFIENSRVEDFNILGKSAGYSNVNRCSMRLINAELMPL
jgi:hypothetical protein